MRSGTSTDATPAAAAGASSCEADSFVEWELLSMLRGWKIEVPEQMVNQWHQAHHHQVFYNLACQCKAASCAIAMWPAQQGNTVLGRSEELAASSKLNTVVHHIIIRDPAKKNEISLNSELHN